MRTLQFLDLGLSEYGITWDRQEQLLKEIVELKMINEFIRLGKAGRAKTCCSTVPSSPTGRSVFTRPTGVGTLPFTDRDSWSVIRFSTLKILEWD